MELQPSDEERSFYGAYKPHALVVAFPSHGHTAPLLQLSIRLASAGVRISFFNTRSFLSSLMGKPGSAADSHRYPHAQQGLDIRFFGLPDGLPEGFTINPSTYLEYFKAIDKLGPVLEPKVEEIITTESPVSCIISDCFMPWTQKVADRFGIPRIAFWTTCASVFSLRLHTPKLIEEGVLPFKAKSGSSEELITGIPGLLPLHLHELPEDMLVEDISEYFFQFMVQRQLGNIHESALVLVNTFVALETVAIEALQRIFFKLLPLGPLLLSGLPHYKSGMQVKDYNVLVRLEKDEMCFNWLDLQTPSSVLYLAFGSVAELPSAQLENLAMALENSQQPFLWVIRQNSSEENLFDVLPDGFLSRTQQRGLCVSWAPQRQVLAHPSVGAFVTHCGWNSIIESICGGVPLIGLPCFSDQRINCKLMVQEWKIGMDLKPEENGSVDSEEITRVIKLMMEGEEGAVIRERVTELRNAARHAAEEGGTSANNMHVLIRYIEGIITA